MSCSEDSKASRSETPPVPPAEASLDCSPAATPGQWRCVLDLVEKHGTAATACWLEEQRDLRRQQIARLEWELRVIEADLHEVGRQRAGSN